MLLTHFLFAQSLALAAGPCTIGKVLANPKAEAACALKLMAEIKNEEDRAEFKFKLGQWKPRKDFQVLSLDGMIDARVDGKPAFRALWLQRANPAILWLDGKILTDQSNNPSLARTIDHLLRTKTAGLFVSEAFAAGDENLVKSTLFFYSLSSDKKNYASAENLVQESSKAKKDPITLKGRAAKPATREELEKFLPPTNAFFNSIFGPAQVRCADQRSIEPEDFQLTLDTQIYASLNITPKSADQFVVRGLQEGVTHLITIKSFAVEKSSTEKVQVLHPRFSLEGSTIAVCNDEKCEQPEGSKAFEEREILLYRDPEGKPYKPQRSQAEQERYDQFNRELRAQLVGKLFGMSVLGSCCSNTICQEQLKNRFRVELKPTSKGSESSAIRN